MCKGVNNNKSKLKGSYQRMAYIMNSLASVGVHAVKNCWKIIRHKLIP